MSSEISATRPQPYGPDDPRWLQYPDPISLFAHHGPHGTTLVAAASQTCYRGETLGMATERDPESTNKQSAVGTERRNVPGAEMKRIFDKTYDDLDRATRSGVDNGDPTATEVYKSAIRKRVESYANNPWELDVNPPAPSDIDLDLRTRHVPYGGAADVYPIWNRSGRSFAPNVVFEFAANKKLERIRMSLPATVSAVLKNRGTGEIADYAFTVTPPWWDHAVETEFPRIGKWCDLSAIRSDSPPKALQSAKDDIKNLSKALLERRFRLNSHNSLFRHQEPSEPDKRKYPVKTISLSTKDGDVELKVWAVPMKDVECMPEDYSIDYTQVHKAPSMA